MEQKKILSNLTWRFAERTGAQIVSLVVSIILARLLEPDTYGVIAIVTVFTAILNVFVDGGLGTALIQKKEADNLDFSTVFIANIVLCILLYGLFFVVAPSIASFFEYDILTDAIRVLGLTVIISGIKNIQQAYVSRNMMFRKFFFSTLLGTIISAIIGITLAYNGAGLWALVIQQLSNPLIDTIVLWFAVGWHPEFKFSWNRLKSLWFFGSKLLVARLIATLYDNLVQLIIGKKYTSSDLAYYNRGKQFPNVIVNNINASIDSILLPTLSAEQEYIQRVKSMTRRAIKTSIYIMAPMMVGMIVIAEPFVRILLTDKWLFCVQYLRIFCVSYTFYPIFTANGNAIQALGRSDYFLKVEIGKKVTGLLVILLSMQFGVLAMAYAGLFSNVICQIINSWPNRKLLNYGYIEQLKDILPSIFLAVFMGVCVNFVLFIGLSDILTIIIQVIFGAVIYIAGSIILKLDSFQYLWGIVKPIIKKERQKVND